MFKPWWSDSGGQNKWSPPSYQLETRPCNTAMSFLFISLLDYFPEN